ncbi:MAG: hypothetical protein SFU83_09480 [Meiothermus sp.]|nr:hypothetical protein [Meiothermus sp.]
MKQPDRWSAEKAAAWYARQPWLVGTNFIPSTACNSTEMWQAESFDLATITRELGWARDLGFNSIRVFLQYLLWKDDAEGLKARFERLLQIADGLGMTVMPVLFDDCVFGWPRQLDPFLGKQREPIPGMILPSWTPCPGRFLGSDPAERPGLRSYVQDFVGTYGRDSRVVIWDLFNEPLDAVGVGTPEFLQQVFGWAREIEPAQPLTVCIYNAFAAGNQVILENSDIISFHGYLQTPQLEARIAWLQGHGRPVICTEWMARTLGGSYQEQLPVFKARQVGCYQWGLVNGRTQCQYSWLNLPGDTPDPQHGWFHDIFYPDGTPYRPEENRFIRDFLRGSV